MATDMAQTVSIRVATKTDQEAIRQLTEEAFARTAEARLVDALRACNALDLEYVGIDGDGKVVGHVAFSTVTGAGPEHRLKMTCLAPISVSVALQNTGIGSAMIEQCLEILKSQNFDLVLVLGPPAYYTRFGFDPVLAQQVTAPYAGDAFMAMAFTAAVEKALPIEVTFATPFSRFE